MIRTYLYIIALLCFSCTSEKKSHRIFIEEAGPVFLKHKYDSRVDQTISLDTTVDLHNIHIAAYGLLGKTTLHRVQDNSYINVKDALTQLQFVAGTYTLYASKNGTVIDKSFFKLHPTSIKGKSTNYVGPKTTSYNDRNGSMITGYFEDEHQNLVDTTLRLKVHIQTQEEKKLVQFDTEHKYYFKHIIPSKNDTKQLVGIGTGDEYSKEITILGSSGCPKSASIELTDRYNVADGHQIFVVDIDDILDDDGHVVSDGTHLALTLRSDVTMSEYNGVVVNGSSKIIVQNPSIAGNYKISIRSCDRIISILNNLIFNPAITEIPYSLIGGQLIIGPLLSQLNQTIPDGTLVSLSSSQCPNIQLMTTQTKNGISIFEIQELLENCPRGKFSITINGVESELILPKLKNNDS